MNTNILGDFQIWIGVPLIESIGSVGLGLIIENFPWSVRNINYSSRLFN